MGAKAIARFVVIVPAAIVVEHPTRMLTAAGFVKKDAVLVGFTLPELSHLALFAMGLRCAGIDMTARIERPTNDRWRAERLDNPSTCEWYSRA